MMRLKSSSLNRTGTIRPLASAFTSFGRPGFFGFGLLGFGCFGIGS
jgi:hypothetical protein